MTTDATGERAGAVNAGAEMAVIHRIFRRGFPELAGLIRRTPDGDVDRATAIAVHTEFMLNGLHAHHTTEDELIWPRLLERAGPRGELVGRMESQHRPLAGHIADAERLLARWRADPSPSAGDELAAALDGVARSLVEHLDEEEAHIVPLIVLHVTEAEWRELGERAFAKFTNPEKLIAHGQMLDVASAAEASMFVANLPLPIRVMWKLVGHRKYERYIAGVRGTR